MKVLVTGSRDYKDRRRVYEVLDRLKDRAGIGVVIEGCASGADRLAELWAKERNVAVLHNPADWRVHGRAAGAIRNREMAIHHKPDLVVAFYSDRLNPSKGTANMVSVARENDILTVVA